MNIREAAKRLLDTDWPLGHVETGGVHEMQDEDYGDLQAVARYAARFEDDTPVDAEWLERVGFAWSDTTESWKTGDDAVDIHVSRPDGRDRFGQVWDISLCDAGTVHVYTDEKPPTRGDVRKLCDVLGVELREDG